MLPLDLKEIIVDLIGVDVGRQPVKMKRQLGQVGAITAQRARALSGQDNFLVKRFIKCLKALYFGTGLLQEAGPFFRSFSSLFSNQEPK